MGLAVLVATKMPAQAVDYGATGQLPPGQQEGRFAFSYSAKIKFVQEDAFPVHVILSTDSQIPVADLIVQDASAFTISTDLPPGAYQIRSEVMAEKENLYWGASGLSFFINSAGGIRYLPAQDSFVHAKKIQMLTPNSQHLSDSRRSGMTLKWAPLRGAVRYHIFWMEQTLPRHEKVDTGFEDTTDQEFSFPGEVHVNRRYEFSIYAFDFNGRKMGYFAPFYFYTVGAQKVAEPKADAPLIGPDKPDKPNAPQVVENTTPKNTTPKGVPFFGVRPVPVAGVGEAVRGGLRVDGIGYNSPASKAGLLVGDVIISFNGVPFSQATTADELADLVRGVAPGTKVRVEFYRKNVPMFAEVTIVLKR